MNVVTVFVEGEGMLDAERESLRAHVREGVARFTRAWTEAHGSPGAVVVETARERSLRVAAESVADELAKHPVVVKLQTELSELRRFKRDVQEAFNPGFDGELVAGVVLAQVRAALRLGVAKLGGDEVRRFVDAYDRWAVSEEHCAGPLFDAMLDAREGLPPSKVDPDAEPQAPLPGVDTSPTNDGAPDDFRAQAWGIVGDGGPYPGDVRTLAIMAGKLDHAMELLVLVHEVVFNPGDVLDPVAVIARVREAARAIRAGRAMQGGSDEVAPIPAPWQR